MRDARSSLPERRREREVRQNIRPLPPRQPPPLWATAAIRSWSDHADEPVDVALSVVQIRRNADVAFAQADDHVFLAQTLVQFGRFLAAARRKTAVRPSLRRIERARRNAAIFRQALEQKIDKLPVVRRHLF